jgi:hypothetical protein
VTSGLNSLHSSSSNICAPKGTPTLRFAQSGAPVFCRGVSSFSFTHLWLRPFDFAQGRLRWGTPRAKSFEPTLHFAQSGAHGAAYFIAAAFVMKRLTLLLFLL